MCGICGFVNRDPAEPADGELLAAMTQALAHRGPDGQGQFIDRWAALGHRRLTIIDRTAAAAQPLANEDRTCWIVFNGEIYNYQSLRSQLIQKGHRFQSQGDSEVILHLYEEDGPECVQQLRGMFAFAIWDQTQETLFLARDRVGKKPLYYAQTPNRFLFASEIKSLLWDGSLPRDPDLAALHHFLSLSYIPAPQTAFAHIRQLPPAHTLLLKNGQSHLSRYWQLSFNPAGPAPTPRQAQTDIIAHLREAVSLRLMSEAPLGVFLSGGLDSSLVLALMAQLTEDPIQTFSIRFQEPNYDESAFSRQVAAQFKTEHHEFTLTPDIADLLPAIARQYDEPFGDPSALPTYYLSKMAGSAIRVALNGDGGDENFGGYDRYLKNGLAAPFYALPQPLRRWGAAAFARLTPTGIPADHPWQRLADFFQTESTSPELLYCRWLFIFQPGQKGALYQPDFCRALIDAPATEELILNRIRTSSGQTFTETLLDTDTGTYLPDDLLVKMDRAGMAFAVENRSPFLDHVFMEYVAALPPSFKIRGLTRKWILKQAAASLLPKSIIQRPKHGFGIPAAEWLRGPLKQFAFETLSSRAARERGYFKPDAVKRLLDEHLSGSHNWQFHLWNLLMLELWHQHCLTA